MAIFVGVVLVLAAGYTFLMGAGLSALSAMDTGFGDDRPAAVGGALALALVAAAVLAVWGHRGRWWVLGLSALTPATGIILTAAIGFPPAFTAVVVAAWLFLACLSSVRPLRQWWARIP